jgi:poly-gamma-glutamate capsule biosynthesis protein CapA/YwtB (metallophosphatase superfamily)
MSINLTGDVMLARLIDQLRPTHVHDPSSATHITSFIHSNPALKNYSATTPWGNTLPLFHSSDLNIINLETAVTTHPTPWPNKAFNYRMHPSNVDFLKAARVHYVSLANNHSLDFCEEGLVETVRSLEEEGIKFAGAGRSREEAVAPAKLILGKDDIGKNGDADEEGEREYEVHVYSASDHPQSWSSVPGFHHINYTSQTRDHLRRLLTSTSTSPPALKIFSIHWGPNYAWRPSAQIVSLAHFLIDECGVDIVHGHSSHHVQGVEVYGGKLIIYGCGDFVDDYAVDAGFRNDVSAVWRVVLGAKEGDGEGWKGVSVKRLEVYPTRCRRFVTGFLEESERDYEWIRGKIKSLSAEFGTEVADWKGEDERAVLVVNL